MAIPKKVIGNACHGALTHRAAAGFRRNDAAASARRIPSYFSLIVPLPVPSDVDSGLAAVGGGRLAFALGRSTLSDELGCNSYPLVPSF